MLRERGVVGKFVEFFGPGLPTLGLADRATIGNMSPEFGSTCAIFPVDRETLRYLEFTGRPTELIELVDAYAREQGMFHDRGLRGPDLLRHARAGPLRRWSRDRRAEAPPGPHRARRRQGGLPRVARATSTPSGRGRSATATTRRSPRPSRPRIRPAEDHDDERGRPPPATGDGGRGAPRRRRSPSTLEDGTEVRARPRQGRDRGDHELHQHLEPVGDGGGRPAREEGGRARPPSRSPG